MEVFGTTLLKKHTKNPLLKAIKLATQHGVDTTEDIVFFIAMAEIIEHHGSFTAVDLAKEAASHDPIYFGITGRLRRLSGGVYRKRSVIKPLITLDRVEQVKGEPGPGYKYWRFTPRGRRLWDRMRDSQ